jgi:putative NIF3 family GTP cyclohydrolase 1 type 2
MAIDTGDIMRIGLDLVGWNKMPSDSAVHHTGENIRKVLITVDVTTAELMLAQSIGCDAVIAHHPIGISSVNFHRVFDRHADYMIENGIPKDVAKDAVKKLKDRVEVRAHTNIYNQVVDAAKILKMPLLNIHQPCDEYMRRVVLEKIKSRKKIQDISDIIKSVREIPEFRNAVTRPKVRYGSLKNEVHHWALVVAAGTNGGSSIAKLYYQYGISTVIYLHIDYTDLVKLKEEKIEGNLVVLGHLAGDSIGLNALADRLEAKGIDTVRMGIISPSDNNKNTPIK